MIDFQKPDTTFRCHSCILKVTNNAIMYSIQKLGLTSSTWWLYLHTAKCICLIVLECDILRYINFLMGLITTVVCHGLWFLFVRYLITNILSHKMPKLTDLENIRNTLNNNQNNLNRNTKHVEYNYV